MLWKLLVALSPLIFRHWHFDSPDDPDYFDPAWYGPQTRKDIARSEKAINSPYLYGGDMVVPPGMERGAGISEDDYRWPGYPNGGEVAYAIDPALKNYKNLIRRAMSQYKQHTCITFVERTNQDDYVTFFKGDGCWADTGRKGGEQKISLGEGCYYIGTVVHEIGHALGLYHEHQRSDRDIYIKINTENIKQGLERKFKTKAKSIEVLYTPFDTNSIMMYGNYAFSKQPGVLKTMEDRKGKVLQSVSRKAGLDKADILQINCMYKCKVDKIVCKPRI